MRNNTVPVAIEMLIFLFVFMVSFLVYTSLAKNMYNKSIEKHEEIELEHVYETEVLTADAVPLTCRVYYTF